MVRVAMDSGSAATQDSELLQRASKGDSTAVLQLYDRHAGAVLALAIRILGGRDEAEEVVQESFVKVWQEAATYDAGRAGFRAWICTIARNRSLDLLRRRGSANRAKPQLREPDRGVEPEAAEIGADGARARTVLATLPAPQREAIELAYFEGLTHTEIAERTGTPLGTVKTRILDGMRKLRDALAEGGSR